MFLLSACVRASASMYFAISAYVKSQIYAYVKFKMYVYVNIFFISIVNTEHIMCYYCIYYIPVDVHICIIISHDIVNHKTQLWQTTILWIYLKCTLNQDIRRLMYQDTCSSCEEFRP